MSISEYELKLFSRIKSDNFFYSPLSYQVPMPVSSLEHVEIKNKQNKQVVEILVSIFDYNLNFILN